MIDSPIKEIKVYTDSIVYVMGERSIHDFHGNGIISEDNDKVCTANNLEPCHVRNFPKPTSSDNEWVQQFKAQYGDYASQVVSLARKNFSGTIAWTKEGEYQVARIKVKEGTLKLMDRNTDCIVDIFEFTPDLTLENNPLDVGLKILRDYSDSAFDQKEPRPVKNPLSVTYLDQIKSGPCRP